MKKYLLFTGIVLHLGFLPAQTTRNCATHAKYLEAVKKDPSILQKRAAMESRMQQWIKENPSANTLNKTHTVLTIPVVIHVIHETSTPAQNISDAQIQTQLDVMNKDFRRLNLDTGTTPSAFKSLGADCEIEFCLAKQDEFGNATTGITRRQTTFSEIGNGSRYYQTSQGGQDNWDPGSYLNIWVCEIDQAGNTFGFAYLPGAGTPSQGEDGVVIDYRFFGTITTVSSPFHLGRTVTHEVGHWLNLEHIWGDATCGDDLVSDTPTQQTGTSGCPSFPAVSCSNGPNGNMFSNYMDYSDDNCMNIFSKGQKDRMWLAITNYRSNLVTSIGCSPAISVPERKSTKEIEVYPNPGNGMLSVNVNGFSKAEIMVRVYNVLGEELLKQKLNSISQSTLTLNLTHLQEGVYFVELKNGSEGLTKRISIIK